MNAQKQAELMLTRSDQSSILSWRWFQLAISRLGIEPEVKLSEHEMMIAAQLVDPASVQVLVYGAWCMVHEAWHIVHGTWCLV